FGFFSTLIIYSFYSFYIGWLSEGLEGDTSSAWALYGGVIPSIIFLPNFFFLHPKVKKQFK
ncbi:MAG: hypothetical protein NC822_05865, partial [Candidatus Omnitrophica bacterium]|nr:hypothetical protein [Candidatus Omnitrophota bacterium]